MKVLLGIFLVLMTSSAFAALEPSTRSCRSEASLSCQSVASENAYHVCLYPAAAEVLSGETWHIYGGIRMLDANGKNEVAYSAPGFGLRVDLGSAVAELGYLADFSASDLAVANVPLRCQPL